MASALNNFTASLLVSCDRTGETQRQKASSCDPLNPGQIFNGQLTTNSFTAPLLVIQDKTEDTQRLLLYNYKYLDDIKHNSFV